MSRFQTVSDAIITILKEHKNNPEEIIYYAVADMNTQYQFQKFYLILLKSQLVFLIMKKETEHFFNKSALSQKEELAEYHAFALSRLSCPQTYHQVVGGILSIEVDGVERQLCAYTNTYSSGIQKLYKLLEKCLKDEPLSPEDTAEDDRQCYCPKCGIAYPEADRKICPKCMDKRTIFFRVLSYFKEYKGKISIILLGILFTTAADVITPILMGKILYDKVLTKNSEFAAFLGVQNGNYVAVLIIVLCFIIFIKIIQQLAGILQGRAIAAIVPLSIYKIKSHVFEAMERLSVSYFTKKQTGSLMTRILNDSNEVMHFFIDGLPYLFVNVATILASVIIMLTLSWQLALTTVVFIFFLFLFSYRMMPVLWHYYGKRHRGTRTLNAQISDNLTGARVVRAFGQESAEITQFGKANDKMKNVEVELAKYDRRFMNMYFGFSNFSSVLVWIVGSFLILHNQSFSLGMLLTFIGYCSMLNGPMIFMSFVFRWWSSSMNSAQRIFEIIDAVPEVVEKKDCIPMPDIKGDIELKNVTFYYEPNKNILKNISFKVNAGEMLGIVGHSGAGKSTLVNIISRLYDATEGEILIDHVNVRDMALKDLRTSIALVSQESYVFMGTIAENIAYAKPHSSKDEIIAAAKAASAHDFICKLPDGYDTLVGAGHRSLSGGERQRLSIARAIIANPKILILDEATASVDTETEKNIQASLEKLIKGRTTISIAHRLSTLRNADKLVVLEEGVLTEEGTHLELINKKGTYYKLMQLQSKALAMRGVGD